MRTNRMMLIACLLGAAACSKNQPETISALEARVAQLELQLAQREDALKFLDMAYEQTVESQTKPEAGKIYGVDIQQNVALGQVIGSPQALVTIVEAWDFA